MADTSAVMGGQEVLLKDIQFHPGADPYSHEPVCKNFFAGWTGESPWGAITWRIIHPDDFPMSEVWTGQIMVGGALVIVNGKSFRLDGIIDRQDGQCVLKSSSDDPKMSWWLFPLQGSTKEAEIKVAQDFIKADVEAGGKAVLDVADHDDALLWVSAYAWALQNTRLSFNQLFNHDRQAAKTKGEIRDEIEAALFRAEWSKEELAAMAGHPRKEVRALFGRIAMNLRHGKSEAPSKAAEPNGAEPTVKKIGI